MSPRSPLSPTPESAPPDPVAADAFAAATAHLHQWRRDHPTATLASIERETDRRLAQVRADLIARLAQVVEPTEPAARPDCPECGQPMRRVGTRQRTLTTAQEGQVVLTGARYRCSACGAELSPPGGDA